LAFFQSERIPSCEPVMPSTAKTASKITTSITYLLQKAIAAPISTPTVTFKRGSLIGLVSHRLIYAASSAGRRRADKKMITNRPGSWSAGR
jgi:hypothetical protein